MIGSFTFDALTIVGVVILMLLIFILIILLVVICYRKQQVDTKSRPSDNRRNTDQHRYDGDRRPPGYSTQPKATADRRYNETDQNDRVLLTKCDEISPTHRRAPPPYESIVDDPVKTSSDASDRLLDQTLIDVGDTSSVPPAYAPVSYDAKQSPATSVPTAPPMDEDHVC